MVKLRLKRMGSINKPFYRIVVLDSRKKRDGVYLESLGHYDPKTEPLSLKVNAERALYWLGVGAEPSDTVRSLLRKAGIMQKWHEMKFGASEKEEKKETKKKRTTRKKEKAADSAEAEKIEKPVETEVVEEPEEEKAQLPDESPEEIPAEELEIEPETREEKEDKAEEQPKE